MTSRLGGIERHGDFLLDAATPASVRGVGVVDGDSRNRQWYQATKYGRSRRLTQTIDGIGTINWTYGQARRGRMRVGSSRHWGGRWSSQRKERHDEESQRHQDARQPQGRVRGRIAGEPPLSVFRATRPTSKARTTSPRCSARRPKAKPAMRTAISITSRRWAIRRPGLPIGATALEPQGGDRRRNARIHRHVSGHGRRPRAARASTRSPTGSRRWRRPSGRMRTVSRRRSTYLSD